MDEVSGRGSVLRATANHGGVCIERLLLREVCQRTGQRTEDKGDSRGACRWLWHEPGPEGSGAGGVAEAGRGHRAGDAVSRVRNAFYVFTLGPISTKVL